MYYRWSCGFVVPNPTKVFQIASAKISWFWLFPAIMKGWYIAVLWRFCLHVQTLSTLTYYRLSTWLSVLISLTIYFLEGASEPILNPLCFSKPGKGSGYANMHLATLWNLIHRHSTSPTSSSSLFATSFQALLVAHWITYNHSCRLSRNLPTGHKLSVDLSPWAFPLTSLVVRWPMVAEVGSHHHQVEWDGIHT